LQSFAAHIRLSPNPWNGHGGFHTKTFSPERDMMSGEESAQFEIRNKHYNLSPGPLSTGYRSVN